VFTGLVQQVATVASLASRDGGAYLEIEAQLAGSLEPGGSVLVNGVCLTAKRVDASGFGADLSPETVGRSNLGELERGDRVNLELPLRLQDRLGGHVVQGHVDAVAEVAEVSSDGTARNVRLSAPPPALRYVVEKGSVTIDGVSLTVTGVDQQGFAVSLIPETLERTTLAEAGPGRRVNLEVDILAKYVEKLVGLPRS
jgi:riboflavin synthase